MNSSCDTFRGDIPHYTLCNGCPDHLPAFTKSNTKHLSATSFLKLGRKLGKSAEELICNQNHTHFHIQPNGNIFASFLIVVSLKKYN